MRPHLEAVVLTLIPDANHDFVCDRMPEQRDVKSVCPAVRELASLAIRSRPLLVNSVEFDGCERACHRQFAWARCGQDRVWSRLSHPLQPRAIANWSWPRATSTRSGSPASHREAGM